MLRRFFHTGDKLRNNKEKVTQIILDDFEKNIISGVEKTVYYISKIIFDPKFKENGLVCVYFEERY